MKGSQTCTNQTATCNSVKLCYTVFDELLFKEYILWITINCLILPRIWAMN